VSSPVRFSPDGERLAVATHSSVLVFETRGSGVPLQLKGATRGVIYADNRLQAGIFTQADLELLSAIASSAAIAIENARLYQVAVEKGRMERELQVAREVQTSLIPRRTPDVDGWDFAARWKPALEVSGDFYDFIPADGRLGIVIADVSDKGMPAALFMALSRSIVRASVTPLHPPADAIGTIPPATAAADPPLDPPGVWSVFQGLRVGPCSSGSV